LIKAPKFYFRDSGIFHALSGIETYDQLLGNRYLGTSWEGYVIEQIRRSMGERWQMFFYRTHTGAEADLVLKSPINTIYSIEIKLSLSTKVSRGFFHSNDDIKPQQQFVIVADTDTFPRADGTLICSLMYFLNTILPSLK
jgi:uncharacterized protein